MDQPIRVLHVDDDSDFLELTAALLEGELERLEIELMDDPASVLDRAALNDIDCIVSDFDMPPMDGIELLTAIRERDRTIPFILYTGKGSEEVASEAMTAGVTDYVQKKPGREHLSLLANRIEHAVRQARTRDRLDTQRHQLEQLHGATRKLMVETEPAEIARIASQTADDILGLPLNAVYLYDESDETLVPAAYTDDAAILLGEPRTIQRDDGLTWQSYEEQQSSVYGDIHSVSDRFKEDTPIRSEIHLPLGDHGLLAIGSPEVNDFNGADVTTAKILAANVEAGFDRAAREREARHRERRYQAMFNDPNILVALVGTDGTVFDINETALRYIDESAGTVIGEPLWETPWFDRSPTQMETVRGWIDRAAAGEYVEFEIDLLDSDDEEYTLEGSFRPVRDDEGEVVSLIISDRDITARKQREKELMELSDRLGRLHSVTRELFEATSASTIADILVDALEGVLEVDLAMVRYYDTAQGGLVPVAYNERTTEVFEERPTFTEAGESLSWRAFESGERVIYDDVSKIPTAVDSNTALRSLMIVPLGDRGTMNAGSTYKGSFDDHDVHLANILAEYATIALGRLDHETDLRQQHDRLDELSSMITHDLRNPLNIAFGHLELARESAAEEHFEAIQEALTKMNDLIDEFSQDDNART